MGIRQIVTGYISRLGGTLVVLVIIGAFALVGGYIAHVSHAATSSVSAYAADGTLTGGASLLTDSNSGSGKAVQFGSASGPQPPAGWSQAFLDTFDGTAGSKVSSSNWLYDLGTGYSGGAANWGTNEIDTATNSTDNVYLDGQGHLMIKPIKDAAGKWTSGRIETQRTDFAAPAGGQLELTARLQQPNPSASTGYWPAFWALGDASRPVASTNWPSIGELDTMEDVNGLSKVAHTFHCGTWGQPPCNEPSGIGSGLLNCPTCQTAYHTYSVIVDRTNTSAEQLRFYLDGTLDYTISESQVGASIWQAAVDHGFYMILNVAIGGSFPDAICNCVSANGNASSGSAMSVDYVAAYTTGGATAPTPTPSPTPTPTPTPTPPGGGTLATSTIQAESYITQLGTQTETTTDSAGGSDVTALNNGDWLNYGSINFGTAALTQFKARLASGAPAGVSGTVEVHLDSLTGPKVASIDLASTGGWQQWTTIQQNMTATTGVHAVYLKFVSGSSQNFANLNWFTFSG